METFGRSEKAINRILSLSEEIRKEFQLLESSLQDSYHIDEEFGISELRRTGTEIVDAIRGLDFAPDSSPNTSGIITLLDQADSLLDRSIEQLASLEQA